MPETAVAGASTTTAQYSSSTPNDSVLSTVETPTETSFPHNETNPFGLGYLLYADWYYAFTFEVPILSRWLQKYHRDREQGWANTINCTKCYYPSSLGANRKPFHASICFAIACNNTKSTYFPSTRDEVRRLFNIYGGANDSTSS